MKYITTKCPYCGFITRNRESELPSVQLGKPLIKCPKCNNFMLDSIQTEYEFMTNHQKKAFQSNVASINSYLGNSMYIIVGALFLGFSGTAEGDTVVIGVLIGLSLLIMGISQIIKNNRLLKNKYLEKEIFKSIIRTSNKRYVELLTNIYNNLGMSKIYSVISERSKFINQNNHLFSQDEIRNLEREINDFIDEVLLFNAIKMSSVSETWHH